MKPQILDPSSVINAKKVEHAWNILHLKGEDDVHFLTIFRNRQDTPVIKMTSLNQIHYLPIVKYIEIRQTLKKYKMHLKIYLFSFDPKTYFMQQICNL